MVIDATKKEEHLLHLKATWKRIGVDLAAKGFSDRDIVNMRQEIEIDKNEIMGWTFEVELTEGREKLVYTLKNKEGAAMLCHGASLTSVGEA